MPHKKLRKKLVLSSFSKSKKRSPPAFVQHSVAQMPRLRLGIGGIDLGFELDLSGGSRLSVDRGL
jgi:hypothetical protein